MKPPVLNRALTLEAPVALPDGSGGTVTDWAARGLLWADIKAGSGGVRFQGEARLSRVPLTITVRAAAVGDAARPVAGQRFREGARIFAILAVTERDGAGRYLTCRAQEEVAA
ncbi:head-tail adaptor [Loktanella sp. DSM 29012]|uniref:head-tail adaptor protein n=1 Tax=Loktanella sp. DSM 29012 TaxID=1881056 RepID=UPI0008D25FCB|nr:head-tail adaptor protein [Loktanella sp. DSM 29012]SEQ17026.1 head-tail adaptor [Loktanella sp. DSM 29012]